jgi:hypothetical protein
MSREDLKYDARYQLTAHAQHLNSIDTPDPTATPRYEIMSGALIWPDETNMNTPIYVVWALRELFAYRTRLMLDNADPDNTFWDECVALFPNWIGFLPERRQPTPELLAEYRRGQVTTKRCLRNLEQQMDADDK